ncbi:MAG: hypothetical protein KZQ89_13420 [Candidatus Thiodiazotropha sp. (ex Lucinoma kastoroae)]|nr:hypothetical protein [Candidatus Thiodiazotropha sp. (ex Rostrolucina anterorostrata)]MCU7839301.1 hypothetical protein [Candidatus Thiodiazotropha sp. (ex Troendleina suluensis)]MCU7848971.1 hypothetical protein [Candidatus Thiodiazotropha sp. (ex Lucinoma kastoroae)]MCU7859394.1 hypothetical protein [Candidatus Thiodiazotropha sp. (ex Lucinoma kastoroae)]
MLLPNVISEEFFVSLTRQVIKVSGSDMAIVSGDGTVTEAATSRCRLVKQEALGELPQDEKRL